MEEMRAVRGDEGDEALGIGKTVEAKERIEEEESLIQPILMVESLIHKRILF